MGNNGGRSDPASVSPTAPSVTPEAGSVILVDLRHIGAEPAEQDQPHVQLLSQQTQEDKSKVQWNLFGVVVEDYREYFSNKDRPQMGNMILVVGHFVAEPVQ